MNRFLQLIATLLMSLLSMMSAAAQKHEYEIKVGEFNSLHVVDNANVVWRNNPDSIGYVQFCGEERFADAFIISNNGKGTLKVQISTEDVDDPALPTLYVYSSFLTEVKSNSALSVSVEDISAAAEYKFILVGNGDIRATGLSCTRCSAKITTGNGVITLSGKCQDASFTMFGTGQIRADELKSDNVSCSIMGTGSIYTWPVDKLSTKGIGSTTIYYRGVPNEIKKRGGGKLVPLEKAEKRIEAGDSDKVGEYSALREERGERSEEIEESEEREESEESEEIILPVRRN